MIRLGLSVKIDKEPAMLKATVKELTVFLLLALFYVTNGNYAEPDLQDLASEQNDLSHVDDARLPEVNWPPGDARWCFHRMWRGVDPEDRIQLYEVLPGLGWDNLVNVETAPVLLYNYSQCRLTDSGHFLIPDNVFIIPLKRSKLQSFAELIDEWKDFKSKTARTINMNPGFGIASYSISGKFSKEYAQVKEKQIEDKSATIRIQLRYHRYKAKLRPGASLSPELKASLLGIAAHLELNQTERARYESEMLIRNFGTHYLTSVTAGAGLVKEDYVKRSYIDANKDDRTNMLASATGAFQSSFFLDLHMEKGDRDQTTTHDAYLHNLTHAYTETLGGEVFLAGGMTAQDWAQHLDSNLVAMDRAGDPLYLLITQETLPELPMSTVELLEAYVRAAFNLYYQMNVIPGCTDRTFSKFSITANFDDGSCKTQAVTGLALGGMYQTCDAGGDKLSKDPCTGVMKMNALTGKLACPNGFTAVLLHEGKGPYKYEYKHSCKWCHLVSKCCHTEQLAGYPYFRTYWCAGEADKLHSDAESDVFPTISSTTVISRTTRGQNGSAAVVKTEISNDLLGYSFGGVFTGTTENLLTNTRTCPEGFNAVRIFFYLLVCISDDDDTANQLSVPFGGFFSCSMGNPLAAADVDDMFLVKTKSSPQDWPKKCPTGYSQHLAIEVNGCAIHYCAESGSIRTTELPHVRRPPFTLEPPETGKTLELVFDRDSMTWVSKSSVQYREEQDEQNEEDPSRVQVLKSGLPIPGLGVGIQRASGLGQHQKHGYVEMRPEALVGIIIACVSLVAITISVSVYIVRKKTAEVEEIPPYIHTEGTPYIHTEEIPPYIHNEGTPLRSSGQMNATFQPNEDLPPGAGDFNRMSYSSPNTDFQC